MIIGFAGKAASGKTTAARQMAAVIGSETMIIPMAAVLREEVEDFLGKIDAGEYIPLVYGNQEDKIRSFYVNTARARQQCPQWDHFVNEHRDIQDLDNLTAVTIRRILQWWGTEYRRDQDPDYWTKAWARKVEALDLGKVHVLVDDIRFMNELNTLKAEGGLIVKIERPGFNGAGDHASETSLDSYREWDDILINDGTLPQFLDKVTGLTRKIFA